MRTLAWFSCGAASACAARLAVEENPETVIVYCDTLAFEHPDNSRFLSDVERWIGKSILKIRSSKYQDIFDVFNKTGWLVGPSGARCTTELKKIPRQEFSRPDDLHVFGLTADEEGRILKFERNNPELSMRWILRERGMNKGDCLRMIEAASIPVPMMYRLGYRNNNCIGCVKGQQGYWNKIRRDFPEAFERMAQQERKMNVAINKIYRKGKRIRVFLDELPPNIGRYDSEPDWECGLVCGVNEEEA